MIQLPRLVEIPSPSKSEAKTKVELCIRIGMDFGSVENAFQEALTQGVFPGAVLLIGKADEIVYEEAFGSRFPGSDKNPMQKNTIFDLASLTKPLATTVAFMLLVHEKRSGWTIA